MALPVHHSFNTIDLTAYTPSCGASPLTAYIRAPFRGTLRKFAGVLGGSITTADCTVTVAVNGTTVGSFIATQAGSAAGLLFSGAPSTLVLSQVNEDDVISFAPSGASGAAVPMHFSVVIREG